MLFKSNNAAKPLTSSLWGYCSEFDSQRVACFLIVFHGMIISTTPIKETSPA